MAEDKNIKDKKPKVEGAAAPAKDAKQEGGIKKKITSWEAIHLYRATRLADIIFNLRNEGWLINTVMLQRDKTRYAEYILIKAGTK